MTNVMMKTCLNQKIIKISNLIQAMKNSVCPKAKVMRRPNFSESRICPNIYRMFRNLIQAMRSVDSTHGKPNLSEYLPNVPKCGLNTRHDNREVTLIHLTRAQALRCKCHRFNPRKWVNDYHYSMLTVLPLRTGSIHANVMGLNQ